MLALNLCILTYPQGIIYNKSTVSEPTFMYGICTEADLAGLCLFFLKQMWQVSANLLYKISALQSAQAMT